MFGQKSKSQVDDIKSLARIMLSYAVREGVIAMKFVLEAGELAVYCQFKIAESQREWRVETKLDPQYHQSLLHCWREMLGDKNQFALNLEEKNFDFSLHYIVEGDWEKDDLILHFKPQEHWEQIC